MILEALAIGGLFTYSYKKATKEIREVKTFETDVKNRWSKLMDSLGVKAENKIKQEYEILDIIPKHYGFDAKVSIPHGKSYLELKSLIPSIEIAYGSNAMINLAPNKTSAYLRVHFIDNEISIKDDLKFKWFKTFYGIKNVNNSFGEMPTINGIDEIKSPYGQLVGYKIKSKIPLGISYKNIIDSYDVIARTLGKCYFSFNSEKLELECSIIHVPFDNMVKFAPIEVQPWELFVGMGYDWQPIILNYSYSPNLLDGGNTRTGKTVAIITAFLNLCLNCDNFKMFVGSYGEKQDLGIFKYMKQCSGFATSKADVLGMLRYLSKEMKRRYKVFSSQKDPCMNIFQYNKKMKKEEYKMEVWHFLTDEVADLVEDKDIQELIWSLARKGAGAGIFVTLATQRGTLANLSAEIKGMLTNKMSFSQANSSSAQTIMGGVEKTTDMVMSLEKKREFVIDYHDGIKIAKTLYLDEDMMTDYLKKIKDSKHRPLKFKLDGTIIEEKEDKTDSKSDKKNDGWSNLSQKSSGNNKK